MNNIYEKYLDNNIKTKADPTLNKDVNKESLVNVEISDTAKALINTINKSEDTRFSEKVEKIRQSIISGSYQVSSEEIAERILQDLELQKASDVE